MRAVSLSLGEAWMLLVGLANASTLQGPPRGGCIRDPHVSFVLQEQLTNLDVATPRRFTQRSSFIAEYRELQRSKQSKHSVCLFKNMLGMAVLPVF